MTVWSWLWVGWLAAFVVIEGKALFNKTEGDTLSEHVWRWFSTARTTTFDSGTRASALVG
ncbi:hypothetical protein [Streptomyces sp. NPDC057909]|uniref:hypothetical protein n=1 Tax=Streptomyces sp. NPDC057909 TaxID=3346277 RepID=UPI0036F13604